MTRLDVGVDLDGVVYDFTDALRTWRARQGVPWSSMPDSLSWHFYRDQWGMTDEEFVRDCRAAIEDEALFWCGPIIAGARWGLNVLREKGHTIHIVTDRAYLGGAKARDASAFWLEDNELPYDTLTITKNKRKVPADIFIDDRDVNYDDLLDCSNPWLFTRPWNLHHPGRRVDTWADFIAEVDKVASR